MKIDCKPFAAILLIAFATAVQARTWTTSDNKTLEADFVSATATHVTLKLKDGKSVPVEIARLIQDDKDYIAKVAAESSAPAPTAPTAGAPVAMKGPYAAHVTGDWKQFEGKGGIQYMFYAQPTLDASKKYPLVLYLHGKNNKVLDKSGLGMASACAKPENYKERPCFILAPQCPSDDKGWSPNEENMTKQLKDMAKTLPIDEDRIYIIGYSMGGYGTFSYVNAEPRMFAAAIPIAGGGNVGVARNLKKIPVWIFHGEKDDVVKPDDSRAIAKALEKVKTAKYTEIPGGDHGIGGKIFADPEVHTWLFAQKQGK